MYSTYTTDNGIVKNNRNYDNTVWDNYIMMDLLQILIVNLQFYLKVDFGINLLQHLI